MLESENSAFEHKLLVLDVLSKLCRDAHMLVEIFLNYDCDINSADLFAQIVKTLCRLAQSSLDPLPDSMQGTGNSTKERYRTQQRRLQIMALESAAIILKSLVDLREEIIAPTSTSGCNGLDTPTCRMSRPDTAQCGLSKHSNSRFSMNGGVVYRDGDPLRVSQVVSSFQLKRQRKRELETGVVKFNVKPKAGVAYLIQHGQIDGGAAGIARGLHKLRTVLNKTKIGEYLGEDKDINVSVLHAYVDQMTFSGLSFDGAIRGFLSGFRLPGEAQKIDRMMARFIAILPSYFFGCCMNHAIISCPAPRVFCFLCFCNVTQEKFAERYCLDNPGAFPSADTAYVLGYSIIMLNTDAHNPNIKPEKKMKKDDFIRNNNGIASGQDLSESYLGEIYDRIVANAISLKEDDDDRAKENDSKASRGGGSVLFGLSSDTVDRRKRAAFNRERCTMVKVTEGLLTVNRNRHLVPEGNVASAKTPFPHQQGKSPETGTVVGHTTHGKGMHVVAANEASASASKAIGCHRLGKANKAYDDLATGSRPGYLNAAETFHTHEHVGPMFEVVWAPLCAVFSLLLQTSDDPTIISLALRSLSLMVRLSAAFGLRTERETLIDTMSKFTYLDTVREMRPKNVECICTLINLAITEGNCLDDSWGQLLQCISRLARLHVLTLASATDLRDEHFFGMPYSQGTAPRSERRTQNHVGHPSAPWSIFGESTSVVNKSRIVEEGNARNIVKKIDMLAIDRVFLNSVHLSSAGIVHFVTALCDVSRQELQRAAQPSGQQRRAPNLPGQLSSPRVFCLQKLVEVADFNMGVRSRYVWSRMWARLSTHFTTVGCHDNHNIAMFAIDSLRQLSMKFLEKDELRDFYFQVVFLRPFEVIMRNSPNVDIRELVLRCCENIVLARIHNIRSGWSSIFTVFTIAARDSQVSLVVRAFTAVQNLVHNYFGLLVDNFIEVTACLVAFTATSNIKSQATVMIELIEHYKLSKMLAYRKFRAIASKRRTQNARTPHTPVLSITSYL